MRESPLRRRAPSGREAIMGTRRTRCPYQRRKALGSGLGSIAYLRFIGRKTSCKRPSIYARLARMVPSGVERTVTGGA